MGCSLVRLELVAFWLKGARVLLGMEPEEKLLLGLGLMSEKCAVNRDAVRTSPHFPGVGEEQRHEIK